MGRFGDLTQSEGFAWGEKMVCLKHLRAGGKKAQNKSHVLRAGWAVPAGSFPGKKNFPPF